MDNENIDVEAFIADLEIKIKEACTKSKYAHLCNKIKTEAGLAWVTNRSIKMMSGEKMKLSGTLAVLESELEGMD